MERTRSSNGTSRTRSSLATQLGTQVSTRQPHRRVGHAARALSPALLRAESGGFANRLSRRRSPRCLQSLVCYVDENGESVLQFRIPLAPPTASSLTFSLAMRRRENLRVLRDFPCEALHCRTCKQRRLYSLSAVFSLDLWTTGIWYGFFM
jgi:hypothetical protein